MTGSVFSKEESDELACFGGFHLVDHTARQYVNSELSFHKVVLKNDLPLFRNLIYRTYRSCYRRR